MKKIIFKTIKNLFLLEEGNLESNSIIYPSYRNKSEKRISEQEAKQIFIQEIISNKIKFSVETPTKLTYSFSGKTPLSGNIDVSTYSHDLTQQTNIEFKASNCAYRNIEKDFQKLICEEAGGIFFHVIESSDSGTLPNIFSKYNKAISSISEDSDLTLALVCLKHRFAYYETFNTTDVKGNNHFFDIETRKENIYQEDELPQ